MAEKQYALKWLEDAKRAPSGGNSQPWQVQYTENASQVALKLGIDPEYLAKISSMDVKGAASVLSLGCLGLNLQILAQLDGFKLTSRTFENTQQWTQGTMTLVFEKGQVPAPLWQREHLENRRTNRSRFIKKEIPLETRNQIAELAAKFPGVIVKSYREEKSKLIPKLSMLETIRWQTSVLLNSVVSEVNFGKDIKLAKDGIPSTQLGADLGERGLLRMVRNFPWTGGIFKIPAICNLAVSKGTFDFIREADTVYLLQVPENSFASFVELGECFQALWLEANKHGIAFQPVGSALVALGFWLNRKHYGFNAHQETEIKRVTEEFQKDFSLDFKKLMLGFRLGYASAETGQAPRKEIRAEQNSELLTQTYVKSV